MDKDEIIAMAREAGFFEFNVEGWINEFERFAAIIAEHWIETNKALAKEIIELKKQAEQEPVGNRIVGNDADGYTVENLYASPQSVNWSDRAVQIRALQAIGAEWYDGKIRNQWIADTCHELTKVIGGAAPVRTKDLTDDEIASLAKQANGIYYDCDCVFARAVIAADRAKNNLCERTK